MSLTSLLLAFAPALAARFEKPEKRARELELEDQVDRLTRGLDELMERLADRDARMNQLALRFEAREQRSNDLLPLPLGGQHGPSGINPQYAQQMQNAMAQQANAQQLQQMMAPQQNVYQQGMQNVHAQQAQLLADGVYQGLLGQLGQAAQNGWHCDCSPSRAGVLTGRLRGSPGA